MTHHDSSSDTSRPLKVAMISHSDMLGGASVVTYRLMKALRAEGVDARMSVYNRLTDDPSVSQVGTAWSRGVRFAWERVRIMASNGFRREDLFKVSTAETGFNLSRDPWVREADVIFIAWINQGLLSLDDIEALGRLGKPVVWAMHDMWCLTGICHHSLGCTRYKESCGRCPLLHSSSGSDLSHRVWS
ncbi:MAG: glycosyl transferase, partial [Paramuribaculum sp.]|nr:glycosyl transferase [Paramuribaculum sp.]